MNKKWWANKTWWLSDFDANDQVNFNTCTRTSKMLILYLFSSSILLILGVKRLQHFALIDFPHWIHTCTNRDSTLQGMTCEDPCAPLWSTLHQGSTSTSQLGRLRPVSMWESSRWSSGKQLSIEARSVSWCSSCSDCVSSLHLAELTAAFVPTECLNR